MSKIKNNEDKMMEKHFILSFKIELMMFTISLKFF